MRNAIDLDVRERAVRWLEEGQSQFGQLLGIISDYERQQHALESSERELEQLRPVVYENEKLRNQLEAANGQVFSSSQEVERLREELSRMRADVDRHARDREEIAGSLASFMSEAMSRLRGATATA
jgi:chromosome segregation ATPase